ncbi:MAG: hypothetical protein NVSMB1_21410 [Polyangiales bacterium]
MKATEAYARLREWGTPVISTADTAAALGQSVDAANKFLNRLSDASLIVPVFRGLWGIATPLDPLLLPEHLTAPYPSYVSLQSALHLHGMIEQIPAVTYVVSLDRTRRLTTRLGTYSIHRVSPEFFGGFEQLSSGVKLATPEKALLDLLYLSATRTRLFAALPELVLPPTFDRKVTAHWIARIGSASLRTMVRDRLQSILITNVARRRRAKKHKDM